MSRSIVSFIIRLNIKTPFHGQLHQHILISMLVQLSMHEAAFLD